MEGITDSTKNIVSIQFYFTINNIPIELTTLSCLCCYPTTTVDMINFQKREFVTTTVCASPTPDPIHRPRSYSLMLFAPLTSFFFQVVVTILFTTFAVSNHVLPHILTVFLTTFFSSPVTILSLSHTWQYSTLTGQLY